MNDDRQMLQKRDQLIEATAKAANVLLTLENFDEAVNTALKLIGEGAGCDRISILENVFQFPDPLPTQHRFIYEWAMPDFMVRITQSELECIQTATINRFFLKHYFLEGEGFGGLLEEWDDPLRSSLAAASVKSAYSVPIRVNNQWWGVLCFDYCHEAIRVSPAEVSVIRTIADCIGSAIQRDRNRREREQVAQQRTAELEAYNQRLLNRDQLLQATARATNVLLTLENLDEAINTALTIIGEGIGCDFIIVLENVLENVVEIPSPLPTFCNFLYEWAAPSLVPLTVSFGAKQLPAELIGTDLLEQHFLEGSGFGGLLEEWNESMRSLLASVQIQSAYAVPIRVNGQWWGILGIDYCRAPIQISSAEVSVLMTTADCIGSAIQRERNARNQEKAAKTRTAELAKANTAMRRSIDQLARVPDMNAVLGYMLREITNQFDADVTQLFLYNAEEDSLCTSVGLIDNEITLSPPYSHKCFTGSWLGWDALLKSPNPRIFNLDTEPELFLPDYLDFHRSRNHRGIVCNLLRQDEQPIGFIGFACSGRASFSEDELELVQVFSQQITLAIQLTRLAEEAQQAALLQERARMAREIHDTLAQAFGGILMQLQAYDYFAETQPEKAQTHLLTVKALAQEGLAEARRSVWTLYLETTEYEDPSRAIAKFVEQSTSGQTVPIQFAIDGTPYRLYPDLGLNLLRIAQEAIANALRHAQAQIIEVYLNYSPQTLQLTIRDDGCGFDPQLPVRGFGLLGMQQRAGRIGANWHLMSQVGQGTTITVTLNTVKPKD